MGNPRKPKIRESISILIVLCWIIMLGLGEYSPSSLLIFILIGLNWDKIFKKSK